MVLRLKKYSSILTILRRTTTSSTSSSPLTGSGYSRSTSGADAKPKIGVFVDDAQSTRMFRNRHFLNLCTRSRHIGSFEGDEASIGISLFIACQNYTATGGGLPRAVRGNATHMALWRTKNKDELNLIAKEMAGEVSPEKFIEVYDYIMMTRRTDMFSCSSTSTKKTAIQVCSAKTTPTSLLCKAVLIRQSSVI